MHRQDDIKLSYIDVYSGHEDINTELYSPYVYFDISGQDDIKTIDGKYLSDRPIEVDIGLDLEFNLEPSTFKSLEVAFSRITKSCFHLAIVAIDDDDNKRLLSSDMIRHSENIDNIILVMFCTWIPEDEIDYSLSEDSSDDEDECHHSYVIEASNASSSDPYSSFSYYDDEDSSYSCSDSDTSDVSDEDLDYY